MSKYTKAEIEAVWFTSNTRLISENSIQREQLRDCHEEIDWYRTQIKILRSADDKTIKQLLSEIGRRPDIAAAGVSELQSNAGKGNQIYDPDEVVALMDSFRDAGRSFNSASEQTADSLGGDDSTMRRIYKKVKPRW